MIRGSTGSGATGRSATKAILLCFLITVLEGYDIQAFGVAAPRLVAELGLDPGQQGIVASIVMIGLVAGALIGGWLGDRIGRRPTLVGSVLVFGLGSIWTGLIHDYSPLLIARLITGIGFGGALPILIAVAAEVSSPERRVLTTSFMFCGMPLGGAGVSLAAGMFDGAETWRAIFLFGGVMPVMLAFGIAIVLPETLRVRAGAPVTALQALFGGGRAAATLLLWTVNFLTLVTLYLLLNWLPSLVVASGHSPATGATASLFFNLLGAVGALAFGWLADRYGVRASLPLGYAALAAALLMLAGTNDAARIVAFAALCGFFTMGAQYTLYSMPTALYPAAARGTGAGASVAVGRLGSIIGPLFAGIARQAGASPADVLRMLVPTTILAGGAVLVLGFVVARLREASEVSS